MAAMSSPARRGTVLCGAAAVLFGATTPIAARLATETTAPVLAGLLYAGAACAALPIVSREDLDTRRLRTGGGRLAVAVLAGGIVGPLLLVAGLSRVPAPTASLLLNGELVTTTLLAGVLFHEHVGRRVILGTALVTAAGLLLAADASAELRWGASLIAAACVCWALDNCLTAGLDGVSPRTITLAKGAVAGSTNRSSTHTPMSTTPTTPTHTSQRGSEPPRTTTGTDTSRSSTLTHTSPTCTTITIR